MMEQKTLEEFSSGIPVPPPILKVPIEDTHYDLINKTHFYMHFL